MTRHKQPRNDVDFMRIARLWMGALWEPQIKHRLSNPSLGRPSSFEPGPLPWMGQPPPTPEPGKERLRTYLAPTISTAKGEERLASMRAGKRRKKESP